MSNSTVPVLAAIGWDEKTNTMFKQLRTYLTNLRKEPVPDYRPVNRLPSRRLIMTEASVLAMRDCMAAEIARGHEGIAYLLGQTNSATTIVIGAIRPEARTAVGSFSVTSIAMARIVRKATDAGLQVIGQIHTHPGQAYHSDGDEDGARIVYDGYVSIVVPDYGRRLPSLAEAAFYFYRGEAFSELNGKAVKIINGKF
jgi:proteasome lid subunit RPN8/RPN11